ncbi:DNA-directed DNA polymerase D large subunit (intein-containing) [Natronomonas moolapensis 8.8.11]|uniref:DNA polymerase II large subunit n=1 Tax=Natronomonas moolapensis (strain DSM 18674 / CECT 7526 / JCM 14361 / 8.8.11) TaxID=268739 RepID=M1XU76_NATM8|nr:DNA-directed DNA polymerase II large subunit [Natronomonas moolapensis]CCQ38052.1 DNA-directed DNA polymerase D large subunit (intein-containing) [Natronomonas moolapensis 8.8.11]
MRPDDERYFERLEEDLDEALSVAREARRRGGDPTEDVEIPIAKDMADRVENILGIDGVAHRVREMEDDPDLSREEAALELAADFAEGTVGDYDTRAGKIEGAVRTAVALLTEGVVAAPIEGIDRVELLENDDGTEFVNIYYAGPIRSAGGTAQALSVLVADYTRTLLGIEEYDTRSDEVERYAEELSLYDNETGLQYAPKDKEAKFIAEHMPVMLDGEATGDEEVSGFRDLERVDTNNARGGMCLVLGEGIAQKAPKIQRYTSQLAEVEWPWLQDLIDGNYGGDAAEGEGDGDRENATADGENATADGENATANNGGAESNESGGVEETSGANGGAETDETGEAGGAEAHDGPPRPDPADKFLRDLIAGRPVFGHPSEVGGFRLRYGRARNHGFATAGVHPATMHLVDDFLATGTQIKTERPGKAAGVVPVDTIEGPTVRLANGDVRRIDDPEEALEIRNGVEAILDLGEYLVNYGEFVENNHPLSPAGYAPEWWRRDLEAAGADVQALSDSPRVDLEHPETEQALEWIERYDAPLHPEYTYLWHDLDVERFEALVEAVSAGHWAEADGATVGETTAEHRPTDSGRTLVVGHTDPVREALEVLLVEHEQGEETLTISDAVPLVRSLGLSDDLERTWEALSPEARRWDGGGNAMKAVNEVAPFEIRERAPTRIGCRMGRPEKSEKRDLSPAVHTLFPINEAGGPQRNVADAAKHADSMRDTPGELEVQVGRRRCPDCSVSTFRARCPECSGVTEPHYVCYNCDIDVEPDESGRAICPNCESEADAVQRTTIDVDEEYRSALENVGERENAFGVLKGVQGLSSEHKVPEPIEKGILRAKNDVSAFKDGTVRYDMTDLPVTSVRPAELDVSVGQLKSLGYEEDIHGQPLTHEEQLIELRVQDVVLSEGAAEHMLRTADFVDDLLEQYYGMERYYELDDREDLIGELVFGMAPHTSAAVVGRVIGFTSAAVGYAHPYFHAAKRRNCFHPETKLRYEDDDGWHYEKIETLVESRLEDPESDDFGALVQQLDGDVYVPSVTEGGREIIRPVAAVSKHVAPEHLIKIETEGGRTLRVTPDHTMLRLGNRSETESAVGIERVPASGVEVGDLLPRDTRKQSMAASAEQSMAASAEQSMAASAEQSMAASAEQSMAASAEQSMAASAEQSIAASAEQSIAASAEQSMAASAESTEWAPKPHRADGGNGIDTVTSVEYKKYDIENTYCLTVERTNTVSADGVYTGQCDGDEDCVMLLMDGIINFSKSFLPNQRGGRMDAPLVMSSRIDPTEIDDEAHNMDIVSEYPREFYEATREMADPDEVGELIRIGENTLGTDDQYRGFQHTHDTVDIAAGPDLSAYKTLGDMMEKMNAQLELSRKLRSVDETDVAERVIEYHFLPDIIGNLRAFSRQETRCLDCGEKFRRVPLTGDCRECGGRVNLTVHEGSVKKYIDTAIQVAKEYGCREYTKQRLQILDRAVESVFEDDTNRPTTLGDYM